MTWKSKIEQNSKSILNDMKGPLDAPLRIWVSQADKVVLRNRYSKTKSLTCEAAASKKPTEETIAKQHADILRNHESMNMGD